MENSVSKLNYTESDLKAAFAERFRGLISERYVNEKNIPDKLKRFVSDFGIEVTFSRVHSWYYGKSVPDNLYKLSALADFFHKSIDYMAGKDTEPTRNMKFIREYTGLSVEFIRFVRALSKEERSELNKTVCEHKEDVRKILDAYSEGRNAPRELKEAERELQQKALFYDMLTEPATAIVEYIDGKEHLSEERLKTEKERDRAEISLQEMKAKEISLRQIERRNDINETFRAITKEVVPDIKARTADELRLIDTDKI